MIRNCLSYAISVDSEPNQIFSYHWIPARCNHFEALASWLQVIKITRPAIAQLVEHLTVELCSYQMVPGSIPGDRIPIHPRRVRQPRQRDINRCHGGVREVQKHCRTLSLNQESCRTNFCLAGSCCNLQFCKLLQHASPSCAAQGNRKRVRATLAFCRIAYELGAISLHCERI